MTKDEKTTELKKERKQNHKKIYLSMLFIVLATVTVIIVTAQSEGFSIENFGKFLSTLKIRYVILAFFAMVLYIYFEGLAIGIIAKSFGYKTSFGNKLTYSASDIYFSAITPSASGGQPASAFFMMQDKIPGSATAVILVVNLIMYTFAILTLGIFCFVIDPFVFTGFSFFSKLLIICGCIAQITLASFFILLLRKENIIRKIGTFFIRFLAKIHIIKNKDKYISKFNDSVSKYHGYVSALKGKGTMLFKTFLCNLMQRGLFIAVTVICFLAAGGEISQIKEMWVAKSMAVLGSNTVPIPGAMGVMDYLLLDIFGERMSEDMAVNLELLSRFISFYMCVILCCLIIIVRMILHHRKNKKIGNDI